MRAAVYHNVGDIRVDAVADPRPGQGEALLRVAAAGICGTDLRIFANGHHRIPAGTARVLGHEFAGEIVAVGPGVMDLNPGMRVGVAPNIGCGICTQCVAGWTNLCPDYLAFGISVDGAFAEYVLIPEAAIRQGNVIPLPDSLGMEEAALVEPLSCCLNGQESVAVGRGDLVVIIGAGPIGIMHLLLARIAGARAVIVSEVAEARIRQAADHGADLVINPEREDLRAAVFDLSAGEGASVVIVAAAALRAQEQSLELAARRGRINFFAGLPKETPSIQANTNLIHYRQLIVTGSTGSNVRQYRTTMELVGSGRLALGSLVGGRLPLEQIREGIERSQGGQEMRILLEPARSSG